MNYKGKKNGSGASAITIVLMVLFALILTLKVSAAVTGDPIGKQLYVATHTSDISTTEEIRQVMQEADEIWPG